MPDPKRHHYVPEMLLGRFTDSDGWLHHFTRYARDRGVKPQRPNSVFVEGYRYAQTDDAGSKDHTLEHEFSALEARADAVIRKIVQAVSQFELPLLTAQERNTWDEFFMAQAIRGPDFDRAIDVDRVASDKMAEIRARMREKYPAQADEIDAMAEPETHKRLIKNAKVMALRNPLESTGVFLRCRGLWIVRNDTNMPFIVGSRPVVQDRIGLRDCPGETINENWLAVSERVLVGVGRPSVRETLKRTRSLELVERYNKTVALQSVEIASSSADLTRAMAR